MEDKQLALKEESKDVSIPTPFPVPVENKENKRGAGGWLNILAYPVSAVSGFLVWKNHVVQEFWGTHGRRGAFKNVGDAYTIEYDKVMEELNKPNNLSDAEKRAKVNAIRPAFDGSRDTFAREKMGFRNVFHYHSSIARHARDSALISGITIFGVSLGAMLMVANSKSFLGGKSEENKDSGISK